MFECKLLSAMEVVVVAMVVMAVVVVVFVMMLKFGTCECLS